MKITHSVFIFLLTVSAGMPVFAAQLEARALLRAERSAVLSSQLDGQVVNFPISEKSAFQQNDVLVEFDCILQQADLKSANADLQAARLKRDNMERLSALSSTSEVDVQLARIDVQRAEARVEATNEMVQRCRLRAPYDGKVVRHLVNQFENVPADTQIVEIIDNNALEVVVIAPQGWLQVLRRGSTFKFTPNGIDRVYTGIVSALPVAVDTASQTVEIVGQLDAVHPELIPGMNGTFVIEYD